MCINIKPSKRLLEFGLALSSPPQIIADTLDNPDDQARAAKYIDERASRGLRSIAVAQAPGGGGGASGGWRLVGLISLLDPPRPDSAATILRAQELGVEVCHRWRLLNPTRYTTAAAAATLHIPSQRCDSLWAASAL